MSSCNYRDNYQLFHSLFNLGGKQNSLSDIGKLVLDNVLSGKFKRKVSLWVEVGYSLYIHRLIHLSLQRLASKASISTFIASAIVVCANGCYSKIPNSPLLTAVSTTASHPSNMLSGGVLEYESTTHDGDRSNAFSKLSMTLSLLSAAKIDLMLFR